jgi:hypothetical protein
MERELFRPVILRPRLSSGFALSIRATSYASRFDRAHKFVTPLQRSGGPAYRGAFTGALRNYDRASARFMPLAAMRNDPKTFAAVQWLFGCTHGSWRWRAYAADGSILAECRQGFDSLGKAVLNAEENGFACVPKARRKRG